MNATIRGNSLKVAAAMVLIAMLFVLAAAFTVQQAAMTGDRDPTVRVTSAGGASLAEDPYIDRHAEVVARYHEGGRR